MQLICEPDKKKWYYKLVVFSSELGLGILIRINTVIIIFNLTRSFRSSPLIVKGGSEVQALLIQT